MDVAIAYIIAGFSTFAFFVLWFTNAYKVLYQKKDEVYKAQEELWLHRDGYQEKRGSPEESTARHMLDTSVQIHEQIRAAYNQALRKPVYWIPGFLMGFRTITREGCPSLR